MKKVFTILCLATILLVGNSVYSQVVNQIADSSFEAGSTGTAWSGTNVNPAYTSNPICSNVVGSANFCGDCGGFCIGHTGNWYVWLGGWAGWGGGLTQGYVSQSVYVPNSTPAYLQFWYKMPIYSKLDKDTVSLLIDYVPIWMSTNADSNIYKNYTKITIPLNTYANNTTHNLTFGARTHGLEVTNFIFDDISIITHSGVGISTNYLLEGINIYPNPTTEKIIIDVNAPISADYNVIMYNMQGQKVFEKDYINYNNSKIEISTSTIAKGAYSLVIDSKIKRIVEKIIVE
ncbi:MAG: T9SS type A sorting domain-containing protein [Bacteroidota bacterium]